MFPKKVLEQLKQVCLFKTENTQKAISMNSSMGAEQSSCQVYNREKLITREDGLGYQVRDSNAKRPPTVKASPVAKAPPAAKGARARAA